MGIEDGIVIDVGMAVGIPDGMPDGHALGNPEGMAVGNPEGIAVGMAGASGVRTVCPEPLLFPCACGAPGVP
jgi:hypothetical protein